MNTHDWTCTETDLHFDAYQQQTLAPDLARPLFAHVLSCERCYARHWQPAEEEDVLLKGLLLDSLQDMAQSSSGESPTLTGGMTSLSLSDWTSAGELNLDLPPDAASSPHDLPPLQAEKAALSGPHLRQVGILLPHVPQKQHIVQYCLYLGDGIPRPDQTARTAARVLVAREGRHETVSVEALHSGVALDGVSLPAGARKSLHLSHVLEVNGALLFFHKGKASGLDKLGVGLLRFQGEPWSLTEALTIGRGEEAQVRLPNRDINTNLSFDAKGLARADMHAEIKSLSLDAIEVSRKHARLSPQASGATLEATGRFPVWQLDGESWRSTSQNGAPLTVKAGQDLIIGQSVFQYAEV